MLWKFWSAMSALTLNDYPSIGVHNLFTRRRRYKHDNRMGFLLIELWVDSKESTVLLLPQSDTKMTHSVLYPLDSRLPMGLLLHHKFQLLYHFRVFYKLAVAMAKCQRNAKNTYLS